jgi:hypothetical protein
MLYMNARERDDCVNPWEVEYQPNPVMFRHLTDGTMAGPCRLRTGFHPHIHGGRAERDECLTDGLPATAQETKSPTNPDIVNTLYLDDAIRSEPLDNDAGPSSAASPATTDLSILPVDKSKSFCVNPPTAIELSSFTAEDHVLECGNTPGKAPHALPPDFIKVNLDTRTSSTEPSEDVRLALTAGSMSYLPPRSKGSGDSEYPCPHCNLKFRTQGLRR